MTRQEFVSLWEYAEHLELTEKGSKLYEDAKALLIKEIKKNNAAENISEQNSNHKLFTIIKVRSL